ncbi:MAG: hypothetical protein ACRDMJ_10035 [Solirubrobacteraceae bacterium]
MKYVAVALAIVYAVVFFWGGPMYASCSCSQAGHSTLIYYFIGWATLVSYLPLYYYRKWDDKRRGVRELDVEAPVAAGSGP